MLKTIDIAREMTAETLKKLFMYEIDAIHIPKFYPEDLSARFAAQIAENNRLEAYKVQNALKRLGMGYVDVGGDAENAGRYHSEALQSIWNIRDLMYPYLTPIDHFRLLLEEVWPSGATLESVNTKKCFVGTCRVVDPGAQMLPHNDRFGRMLGDGSTDLTAQLAFNVYLQMPDQGGEIELWLKEPTVEQDRIQITKDGLDRAEIGEPELLIKPGVGDLVLFNSRLIHGVTPGVGKRQRVTTSCFVGYRDDESPLTYWS